MSVFIDRIENLEDAAQEDLLRFLNGEARRRNLLFFVATPIEPRDLVTRHGFRRDLFVRMNQTEVRLPPLAGEPAMRSRFIADVVYDLVRIQSEEMSLLREKADTLANEWRLGKTIPVPADYDFVAEALSYVLWDARRVRASALLGQHLDRELENVSTNENFRSVREGVAAALSRLQSISNTQVRAQRSHPDRHETTTARTLDTVPTHLDHDTLLRNYYQALLIEEGGDVQRVAQRADQPLLAVHDTLERLALTTRRLAAARE